MYLPFLGYFSLNYNTTQNIAFLIFPPNQLMIDDQIRNKIDENYFYIVLNETTK